MLFALVFTSLSFTYCHDGAFWLELRNEDIIQLFDGVVFGGYAGPTTVHQGNGETSELREYLSCPNEILGFDTGLL